MDKMLLLLLTMLTLIQTSTPQTPRLSTYCSSHTNCPESSTCSTQNYCDCFEGYYPPDRRLNSCLRLIPRKQLYDARFTFLSTNCQSRLNCPANAYCDPVDICSCLPGFVTLDKLQCSFEREGLIPIMDERYRKTRLSCRADVNCPEDSKCAQGECVCHVGLLAGGAMGEGFHSKCTVNGGGRVSGSVLAVLLIIAAAW